MSESLAFDILAIDRASEVFRRVAEHGDEMQGRLSKAAHIAGAALAGIGIAAAGIAFEVGKIGFEEFTKNQSAVAQLDAVIKSTGGSAGATSEQIQKLGDKIQGYSGQTHESIDASATLLMQFGNIRDTGGAMGNVLDRATSLTADIAARMGGSASDSAIKLGRALTNPTHGISALTRMGVTFTDAQKKQIAAMQSSGDLMGAQNLVLDALTQKYGGAAKAAGETLPGQLNRAKLAFEDVAAKIVEKLIPVMTALLGFINDKVLPGLKELWAKHGPAVEAMFSRIGTVITTKVLPVIVAFAEKEWPKLVAGIQSGEQFITAHLVPALQNLEDMWERNRVKIEAVATKIAEFVGWVVANLIPLLIKLWATELVAVVDAFEFLATAIGHVVNGVKDIINFGGQAVGTISKIAGAAGGIVGKAGGVLKSIGFAGGTTNAPGGLSWVGENGPELVNLPRGASVTPAGVSAAAVGGAGGDVHITLMLQDGTALHRLIVPAAQAYKRRNGSTGLT